MINVEEIREQLASVSSGELPLWDFYNWLEEASLNMHQDSSAEAIELAGKAGVLFAEFDRGNISQAQLATKLCRLAHMVQFFSQAEGVATVSASSTVVRWSGGSGLTLVPVPASARI